MVKRLVFVFVFVPFVVILYSVAAVVSSFEWVVNGRAKTLDWFDSRADIVGKWLLGVQWNG